MGEEASSPEIPGRIRIADLVREAAGLTLASFKERFPSPFLFQMNDSAANKPLWQTTTKSDKHRTGKSDWAPPSFAFRVAKRDGANVFNHMITVGRAVNNDVVLPYPPISKFHASIIRGKSGWTIQDARSANGTVLEGTSLPAEKPHPLKSGASVELGREIVLVFVEAAHAFEFVETMRSRGL